MLPIAMYKVTSTRYNCTKIGILGILGIGMSQRILDMLNQVEPDYHPLVSILKVAKEDKSDARLRFDCHREIAKYVEAQRRSVDVKSGDGSELVSLSITIDGVNPDKDIMEGDEEQSGD